VLDVRRGADSLNVQAQEGRLSLPVVPGAQTFSIDLRQQGDVAWETATPAIDLGLPAANVDLQLSFGEPRWVLTTNGPAVGPVVLYWAELVAALAVALLLAHWGRAVPGVREWLLLVLGFSLVSWPALIIVALWLLAADWRGRAREWSPLRYNALHAGFVTLSVIAALALVGAVFTGLTGAPHMDIRGSGSGAFQLHWFVDKTAGALPTAEIFSLPLEVYRLFMLAWTLWLAWSLLRWLRRIVADWAGQGWWKTVKVQ